jgi:hypothetical protein
VTANPHRKDMDPHHREATPSVTRRRGDDPSKDPDQHVNRHINPHPDQRTDEDTR